MAEADTFAVDLGEAITLLGEGDDVQYRAPEGSLITSVRVTRVGDLAQLVVWNRGGNAGVLTVNLEDAAAVAGRLMNQEAQEGESAIQAAVMAALKAAWRRHAAITPAVFGGIAVSVAGQLAGVRDRRDLDLMERALREIVRWESVVLRAAPLGRTPVALHKGPKAGEDYGPEWTARALLGATKEGGTDGL